MIFTNLAHNLQSAMYSILSKMNLIGTERGKLLTTGDGTYIKIREATVYDTVNIGGREYPVVRIGNQLWTGKNLDWNFDGNGTYYNNDSVTYGSGGLDFGLLYTWTSVDALNSLLPTGWRVATRTDFSNLFNIASNQASKLKTTTLWDYSGTDEFGWNGVPSGHYSAYQGKYEGAYLNPNDALLGMDFWTSESYSSSNAYDVYYRENNASFSSGNDLKGDRYSVRLVKDVT